MKDVQEGVMEKILSNVEHKSPMQFTILKRGEKVRGPQKF